MKRAMFAVVIAALIGGFVASGNAQAKKLPPHPDTATDKSSESGVGLPGNSSQAGQESPDQPKPKTGAAASSGGQSNAGAKKPK
jgi:hypothetical protein